MHWLPLTLFAAFMQAWRNAFQKQLSPHVPVLGVTLARFLGAWPLALLWLGYQYLRDARLPLPAFTPTYLASIIAAASAQIAATALLVQLFRLKNYAVGVGLARSEAVLAAILGVACFGTRLNATGWLGVLTGGVAVFLLSGASLRQLSWRALALGLGSGLCFAFTSLFVRQAALALPLPALPAAAWVLASILILQTAWLLAWLLARDRAALRQLLAHRKLMLATSTASFLGSLGWFSAMRLQDVAIVKTVGQIEVLFMIAIATAYFKERLQKQDGLGLALIVIAAVLVVWA